VPRVHFDEAWYAYGKFHPIYKHRFAMGVPNDMKNRPTVFAVQSTHKMLPAFSMASYIHVSNSERGAMAWAPIKEAFMMHGTTSPFYPLIASLDIASAMMDEPTGPVLLRETSATRSNSARRGARGAPVREGRRLVLPMFQPDKVRIDGKSGAVPPRRPMRCAPIRAAGRMRSGRDVARLARRRGRGRLRDARPHQGHDPLPRHGCAGEDRQARHSRRDPHQVPRRSVARRSRAPATTPC
jgi:hypothetical protein